MKSLIIGDLHLGIKNNTNFINYQIEELNKTLKFISDNNIENVIFLGDIFDNRQNIDINILYNIIDPFEKLNKINVYIIVGNHDTYFKTTNDINSLSTIFKKYNFNIIDKIQEINIDGEKCLFVPWMNKYNFENYVDKIKKSNAKYCFGHFAINDFYMIKGVKEQKGLEQSIFKKFEKTFSGHFHLKDNQKNIIYVGSHVQLNWNDYNDKKRMIFFDTDTEIKNIELSDDIFKKIFINNDTDKINPEDYKNKIVKIYVEKKLKTSDINKIDKIKELVISCEIIDNTILIEKINENVKSEDFSDMLKEMLESQENLDEKYKESVNKYLNKKYNDVIQGRNL